MYFDLHAIRSAAGVLMYVQLCTNVHMSNVHVQLNMVNKGANKQIGCANC